MSEMTEIAPGSRDQGRCSACGGTCCKIYKPAMHQGVFRIKVEIYAKNSSEQPFSPFSDMKIENLPERRFDPIRAWGKDDENYREELIVRGIDPYFCEYCSPAGCIIPWDDRPLVCRSYKCFRWLSESRLTG